MKIQFIFCFLLIHTGSLAQSLSGKITSADGNPIPFASVYVKNSTLGTTSNLKGVYQLKNLPKKAILMIS